MPVAVIFEAVQFAEGRLISPACARHVLNTTVVELVQRREIVQGKESAICESVANTIAAVIRRWDEGSTSAENTSLDTIYNHLLEGIIARQAKRKTPATTAASDADVRKAAVASALILAGVIKYIAGMQNRHETKKRHAQLALGLALSALGYAPIPAVAGVAGTSTLLANAIIDHFWKPPLQGVETVFRDFIRQDIYWPLMQESALTKFGITRLDAGHRADFRDLFDLVMGSCHVLGI